MIQIVYCGRLYMAVNIYLPYSHISKRCLIKKKYNYAVRKIFAYYEKKITAQRYNCKSLYNFASSNNYTDDTGKKQTVKMHISRDIEFEKETLCLCVFMRMQH